MSDTALDLILEIGCEEIPHDLLEEGCAQLQLVLSEFLEKERLAAGSPEAYATPRRLTAIVHGIPAAQPTVKETVTGPPESVARDADGKYTRAAEGFAHKQGVTLQDLITVETKRGPYLAARKTLPGRPAKAVLSETLPEVLANIHWAKAMRWGTGVGPFARPVRWICAVLGGNTVEFEFSGVKSGNESRGHRFMSPQPFTVSSPEDYLKKVKAAKVVLSPADRQARIREQLAECAKKAGGHPVPDGELVSITAAKTEWPVAVMGRFDEDYLELPREVLTTSMREHQDDFAVEDEGGRLLPVFINFADNEATDPEVVAHGNLRVLRARLEDARFFFREDRKRRLADYAPRLDSFLFQKELGSMGDKARRVTALARELAPGLGADPDATARAAALCKCDLVTNMVYEFPELQGIMGRTYALADGEPKAVATAIEEHYLPLSAMGDLPATPEGRAVAVADKLDTLCGIFGVGMVPSGSQDPYALRRAGAGVVRMLAEAPTGINLYTVPDLATKQFENRFSGDLTEVAEKVAWFLVDRLIFALEQEGLRPDVVLATVNADLSDVHDTAERARALNALTGEAGFDNLMTGCKRIARIIPDGFTAVPVSPGHLTESAERELWNAFEKAEDTIGDRSLPAAERLAALAGLRPQIDRYFDDVLVMDKDEAVRNHRLSMLSRIRDVFGRFADFSAVVVD